MTVQVDNDKNDQQRGSWSGSSSEANRNRRERKLHSQIELHLEFYNNLLPKGFE